MKGSAALLVPLLVFVIGFVVIGELPAELESITVKDAHAAAPQSRPTPTPGVPSPQDLLEEPSVSLLGPWDELPDLVVREIRVDQVPRAGITTTVWVVVKNQGTRDVGPGNNFYVDLYIDPGAPPAVGQPGTLFMGVQGYLFKAGESVPLPFEVAFPRAQSYTLYAQVDTGGNVVESDEENNILGPFILQVRTDGCVVDTNHQDFQAGFSNMDITHPLGLIVLGGVFEEPTSTPLGRPVDDPLAGPNLYNPDFGVSDFAGRVNQVSPTIARNAAGHLFIAWEDGRHGELSNRRIYFSRSLDSGATWSADARISPIPLSQSVNQRSPHLLYDPNSQVLYAAWYDNRNGHYDIWVARSQDDGLTWTGVGATPINDDTGSSHQLNPSLAVSPKDGTVYLVWQDQRHGNDDIYFAFSEDAGITWSENILVTDHPASTMQSQRSPSVISTDSRVYVVWEDGRNEAAGDPADIYFTWGRRCSGQDICTGYTFDVDRRVNNDATVRRQKDPTIASSVPRIEVTKSEAFGPDSLSCSPSVTTTVVFTATYKGWAVHFAWQDFRNGPNSPDIYYAWTFEPVFVFESMISDPSIGCMPTIPFYSEIASPFGPNYPIYGNDAVSNISPFTPGSCLEPPYGQGGRQPCEPAFDSSLSCDVPKTTWLTAGSIQEYPTLSQGPPETDIVYILWSDKRNYDARRSDIYVARPFRERHSPEYQVGENLVVNSNPKLLQYLQDDRYLTYAPASVRRFRPAGIYSDDASNVPYVVWDDDRRADPLAGSALERNIFFARPGKPPEPGVYMSRIFEAPEASRWSLLEWWGVTPVCTRIYFQTRTGNTPWPDGSWSDWTGPVWDHALGKWIYPAPAAIVDGARNPYPESTYFQYRLWIEDCEEMWKMPYVGQRMPQAWVSKVIVHYEPATRNTYLPLILKQRE